MFLCELRFLFGVKFVGAFGCLGMFGLRVLWGLVLVVNCLNAVWGLVGYGCFAGFVVCCVFWGACL